MSPVLLDLLAIGTACGLFGMGFACGGAAVAADPETQRYATLGAVVAAPGQTLAQLVATTRLRTPDCIAALATLERRDAIRARRQPGPYPAPWLYYPVPFSDGMSGAEKA